MHTAAQPSHDWAAKEPFTDFGVNATGTLHVLEAARLTCPEAPFIFTSTNKVYGDTPNRLPLVELEKRWEIAADHPYFIGIDEHMSIDQTKHSLFGASKVAADVLSQAKALPPMYSIKPQQMAGAAAPQQKPKAKRGMSR